MKKLIVLSLFIVLGTTVYAQNYVTDKGYIYSDTKLLCEEDVLFSSRHFNGGYYASILIKYPQNKQSTSYTIPDGINTIAKGAFQDNKYIKKNKNTFYCKIYW